MKGDIRSVSRVKVKYYGMVQNVVGNLEKESFLSDDTTVGELLQSLVQRYGDEFKNTVLAPDGQLLPVTVIHLNGRDISDIDGLNTKLPDSSELTITVFVYIMSGG